VKKRGARRTHTQASTGADPAWQRHLGSGAIVTEPVATAVLDPAQSSVAPLINRAVVDAGAGQQPGVQARPPGSRLAVLAAGGFIAVIVFQLSIVLGAPFGAAAWGGTDSGRLPADLRLASAFAAAVWSIAALTVLSRGGFKFSPVPPTAARRGTWALVGLLALGTVMNLASTSNWERFGWAPLVFALALACYRLARTDTAT
jgi:hypothetical protein